MKVIGIEGMTADEIKSEIHRGGTFVIYHYCISLVVVTLMRPSSIYFIKGGHGRLGKGLPFTLISLLLGWWGIPWGPSRTIQSFITNFGGGKDVTQAMINSIGTRVAVSAPAHRPIPD